jgi:hypothetical protein
MKFDHKTNQLNKIDKTDSCLRRVRVFIHQSQVSIYPCNPPILKVPSSLCIFAPGDAITLYQMKFQSQKAKPCQPFTFLKVETRHALFLHQTLQKRQGMPCLYSYYNGMTHLDLCLVLCKLISEETQRFSLSSPPSPVSKSGKHFSNPPFPHSTSTCQSLLCIRCIVVRRFGGEIFLLSG